MFQNENQFPKRPRLSEPFPNRKTQLCLRFQRGTCDYGNRCCFAHGNEELRGFDDRQKLIPVNEVSRCGDRSRLCRRFMNGETCQFGDKCHFYHLKIDRASAVINVTDAAGNGEMQLKRQTPWRTKLCHRWMSTGSCPYGLKCCYAHGESELQKQGWKDARDYTKNAPWKWISKTFEKKIDGKQWENVEKIGRVYADWIDDAPLVHVETGNLAN